MMNIRNAIELINTRTVQYIIGTICILILVSRLEHLFRLDEKRTLEQPKNYRKRFGRIVKSVVKTILSEK